MVVGGERFECSNLLQHRMEIAGSAPVSTRAFELVETTFHVVQMLIDSKESFFAISQEGDIN